VDVAAIAIGGRATGFANRCRPGRGARAAMKMKGRRIGVAMPLDTPGRARSKVKTISIEVSRSPIVLSL
jgi:hypothetical protein